MPAHLPRQGQHILKQTLAVPVLPDIPLDTNDSPEHHTIITWCKCVHTSSSPAPAVYAEQV